MFFRFAFWVVYIVLRPIYRWHIEGFENLPAGKALICGNHTANADPVLIGLALGARSDITFMAKAELFQNKLFGWVLRHVNAFPINRKQNDINAMKMAMKNLKEGKRLMIFPEGTRVKAGEDRDPSEAKAGAGMLALRTQSPMVPVYITPGKKAFRGCRIVFGQPFTPSCEGKPGPDDYKQAAEEVLRRVYEIGKREVAR